MLSRLPRISQILEQVRYTYPGNQVKRDDVLDALVAAGTAWLGKNGLSSIPEQHKKAARGLTMEMVYFQPDQVEEAIKK
jgi:predicted RNase H-like nuclease